ncbi:MAG: hypothetical protein IKG56_01900 [Clostridia bacterium]|nr:hypothetical protein [Clostridia bacterium]
MNYNKKNINILAFFISIVLIISINMLINYVVDKEIDNCLIDNSITELTNNIE